MRIEIKAVAAVDGKIRYTRSGAEKPIEPFVRYYLERQLATSGLTRLEVESFVKEFDERGSALCSAPARIFQFMAS